MPDHKKIPEFYDRNALKFDDDTPEDLTQFSEAVEWMMELAETPDDEKNAFIVRYTVLKTRNLWKRFETFTKTYDEFKKEILNNYPSAIDTEWGTVKKLRKVLKKFDNEDIGSEDQDELMKLAWEMHLEAAKLLASGQLTDQEAVPMFLDKLDNKFQERILDNLESDPPQLPAGVQIDAAIRTWTLKEVMDEAKRIATRRNVNSEFFGNDTTAAAEVVVELVAESEVTTVSAMMGAAFLALQREAD
ncbi:hypothetical protein K438DRAFT_1753486 [Mycena galopus ATCC 62051]|nr:hypothetical protein K438DRAFT_1753486 [Mycena galopus ATCC 62051]